MVCVAVLVCLSIAMRALVLETISMIAAQHDDQLAPELNVSFAAITFPESKRQAFEPHASSYLLYRFVTSQQQHEHIIAPDGRRLSRVRNDTLAIDPAFSGVDQAVLRKQLQQNLDVVSTLTDLMEQQVCPVFLALSSLFIMSRCV